MVKAYPVRIVRGHYKGGDPKKRAKMDDYNRIADKVETYINARLGKCPDGTFGSILSYEVAREIGEDDKIVHRIIMATDGGSTGITVWKGPPAARA